MSSKKLKKYLAYYRRVLAEDPENIEARLRLAVLFREMGRPTHAIEEYGMAAKLLAREGLPLEAIAACKAILELDSSHQETLFFLAKLYARVPEASGDSVRVARPMGPTKHEPERQESQIRVQDLTRREIERLRRDDEETITLERPKRRGAVRVTLKPTPATEVVPDGGSIRWQPREVSDELMSMEEDAQVLEEQKNQLQQADVRGERQFRLSALPEIPLFSRLPRNLFVEFLEAMELRHLDPSETVLAPDDPASCLFVIVNGSVRVERELLDGRCVELATMGEGEVFGEFRLLTGNSGHARVVAASSLEVLTVSDELVFEIGRRYPEMWDILWEFYFERMLNHCMAASRIFGGLSNEERELVAEHFERAHVLAGDVLFEQGEAVDWISLVVSGAVQVEVATTRGIQVVEHLREGAFLGVGPVAMMLGATATARAVTDLVVMNMPGRIFRELIKGLPEVAEAVDAVVQSRRTKTARLIDEAMITKFV